jgi:hypothetical protein
MAAQQHWREIIFLLLLCCAVSFVIADPSGATVTSASSTTGPNQTAASRADARSTITTLVLNSIQQSSRWKAYVGNVTGTLTLDNPSNQTIYAWDLSSFSGEVYASRYGNLSWSSVSCAPNGLIQNESATFAMTTSEADRINITFNGSTHRAFTVGSNTINANSCNSTVLFVNDTRQTSVTTSSPFQELLVRDATGYLVYLAEISDNTQGFDNSSYDFQMIVPENITGAATSYYFYVELG